MRKGEAQQVELPVAVSDEVNAQIARFVEQTGMPMSDVVLLALAYSVHVPQEHGVVPQRDEGLPERHIVRVVVSNQFHLALRLMEIRTPDARGRLVERGLPLFRDHLGRVE